MDVILQSERRVFTARRAEQGFRDQAHLDAFYRHFDHVGACGECREGAAWVDDCWQGTVIECAEARRLFVASR